jgi:hypothetical protein
MCHEGAHRFIVSRNKNNLCMMLINFNEEDLVMHEKLFDGILDLVCGCQPLPSG